MGPFLKMINKVIKYLQSVNCDLLFTLNDINNLRTTINGMRCKNHFKYIYDSTVFLSEKLKVVTLKLKICKLSDCIDSFSTYSNQFSPNS